VILGVTHQLAGGNDEPGQPVEEPKPHAGEIDGASDRSPPIRPELAIRRLTKADRDDLEAFFDGAIGAYMENRHVAGATIAVVSGDEVIFEKGYGYADVEKQTPVDPQTTMFRIGSVSKLITWTAVMQLAEQGKLDLNADINTYLQGAGVSIPETFPQPITLKHLLTHTPGFEDRVIGLFAHDAGELQPLGKVLNEQLPARVRPPGELASYSNHGTALAGYIVERVSGMPWADYIEQRILTPLGMEHTTVRQPRKHELPANLSKGYKYQDGRYQEQDFEYVPIAPAGSASSSAGDMARFLLAHLNDGQLGEARILQVETARQMHEPLFQPGPKLDAMCYGFMEMHRNGQRLIHHGGATFQFFSSSVMIPEHRTGLFVSFNTNTAASLPQQLTDLFLDRYYPSSDPPRPKPPEGFKERAQRFVGAYKAIRHDYTHAAKLGQLLAVANVSLGDDDALVVGGPITLRLAEVAPLEFAEIGGQERVLFREDANGNITQMFVGTHPAVALQKLTRYETPSLHASLLGGSVLVLVSALLGWPFVFLATRGRLIAGRPATVMSRSASWIGWLGSATLLAVLGALTYLFAVQEPNEIAFGLPWLLGDVLRFSPACLGVAVIVSLCSMLAWAKGCWRLSGRIHYSLVALAAATFVWQLYYWNLMPLPIGSLFP